ncbi:MAG: response regulator [Kiritimatiellae bacterium]|nr:response regulator [Kiritimatiellia bacterium]
MKGYSGIKISRIVWSFFSPIVLLAVLAVWAVYVAMSVHLPALRSENHLASEEANLQLAADAIAHRLSSGARAGTRSLADTPEIVSTIAGELPPDAPEVLRVLDTVQKLIDAEIVYVMNSAGTVVASTRYNGEGSSLTGKSYEFRPYFIQAMQGKSSIYAAVGVTTGRRGLYFSEPVQLPGAIAPAGVVVAKMGLITVDEILALFHSPVSLLSPDGIVFASNRDDWLLKAAWPLSTDIRERLHRSRQFSGAELVSLEHDLTGERVHVAGQEHVRLSVDAPLEGWRLVSCVLPAPSYPLTPQQRTLAVFLFGVLLFFLIGAMAIAFSVWLRRQAEERYRQVVENMSEALVIIQNERVAFFNERMVALLGYTPAKLRSMGLLDPIYALDRERVKAFYEERLASESKKTERIEIRMLCPDGSTLWTLVSAVRVVWRGHPAVLAFLVDISEEKALRDRLSESARMEAIGQLAGGIAHDFNNLLVGILGYSEILRSKLAEDDTNRTFAEAIETAARRAAELTEQLLGFAQRGRHRSEPVNMHMIIEESVELLSRTLGENIQVETRCVATCPAVLGDRSQLKQVIANFGVNARDAMPDGGRLTIATADIDSAGMRTRALPFSEDGWIEMTVMDTGCGISERFLGRIFEPFFTTKGKGKGTGMGLAMIYGIVANHKGTIGVSSEVGKGTTFTICLPRTKGMDAQSHGNEVDESVDGLDGHCIMVVDDEAVVVNVAAAILLEAGCRVESFTSGTDAVGYYGKHGDEIDLVLLDMEMPGMDGGECFRALKEINPDIKVLLSTGYGLNGKAQGLLNEGMLGLIQKPYAAAELCRMVRQVLSD